MREYIHPDLRQEVLQRDRHTCRYCGMVDVDFHMDHVYPVSKGGETSLDNLVTACPSCNHRKNARVGVWPKSLDEINRTERIASIIKRNYVVLGNIMLAFDFIGVISYGLMAYAIEAKNGTVGVIALLGMYIGIAGYVSMLIFDKYANVSEGDSHE